MKTFLTYYLVIKSLLFTGCKVYIPDRAFPNPMVKCDTVINCDTLFIWDFPDTIRVEKIRKNKI